MKGVKKYTQSFETSRQLAMEKMGKAENSTDSQETKDLKEMLHLLKWALKSIKCMGDEYVQIQDRESDKGSRLGEVMKAAGTGFLEGSGGGDALFVIGDLLREISSNMKASSIAANNQIVIPLSNLYREEVKSVLVIKSKQEMARVKYEAATGKLKEVQKKKNTKHLIAAEEEYRLAKQSHAEITVELHKSSEALILSTTRILLPQFKTYAAFQAGFFANTADRWKQVEQRLLAVEKNASSSSETGGASM